MAPRKSTLPQPSSWRKSIFHCLALTTALLYSSCRIAEFPSLLVVEAKTTPSAAVASRLSLSVGSANNDASSVSEDSLLKSSPHGWGTGAAGLSHLHMRQKRARSPLTLLHSPDSIDIKWSNVITSVRGGSSEDESEEYDEEESSDDEYDSEEYDTDSDEEDEYDEEESYEDEDEEEEKVATAVSLKSSILSKSQVDNSDDEESKSLIEYDDLLTPPAMQQFGISIGVMMLSNRVDILNAKAVRIARFAFLAYIVSVQVFVLYVRLRAKSVNDRTPITISNPLASLVENGSAAAGGGGGNFMVKALANQVLSTQTTILEYDLKQAKKMNGGLLFPMVFLYFLHFRMKQVQPLLMQTATGVLNLVYSPLFQVYVLGRNLERPFKPPVNPMMEAMQAQQQQPDSGEEEEEEDEVSAVDETGEEESDDADDEEDETEEGVASDEEDESDDDEEYDSDSDEE